MLDLTHCSQSSPDHACQVLPCAHAEMLRMRLLMTSAFAYWYAATSLQNISQRQHCMPLHQESSTAKLEPVAG